LLLAHGAPDQLDDIPEFLLNVRNGRPLPPPVVEEIKHRYALIGGGSPLLRHSRRQAELLAARLGLRVYLAMRNWRPFIAEVVPQILADGIEGLVVLCLAPHNSRTSVGLYRGRLEEALAAGGASLAVRFVESWHDNRQLIVAFAEKLRAAQREVEAAAGSRVPVIFTAHSVPERTIAAGDPYDSQVQETVALVAAAAGCPDWQAAYQSQGMTAEPWLGPTVESAIDQLAAAGHRHVLLAPIGFLCDHVEILYDVDIAFRNYARGKGVALHRTESLNESPLLIEALASVIQTELAVRARDT
jgi:ferrochelatase